jgi:NADPH2:quinone reductase
VELPALKVGEAVLESEGFGLNFADVMARKGLYQDAPTLPCVIGYEAVGRLLGDCGPYRKGQRMLAFTRFGGYASHIIVDERTIRPIPDEMPLGEALALAVQFCTAYHAAYECTNIFPQDHVLVQAAAGGVGTMLVQLLKLKGCTIYGTAGSDAKLEYLRQQGVHHPINYRTQDFQKVIGDMLGQRGLDVVFDSLGGESFSKGYKALGKGGRIVAFGAAEQVGGGIQLLDTLRMAWNFGIYSPIQLLLSSKGMIGINMLHIADDRPHVLSRCMEAGIDLWTKGEIKPTVGAEFPHTELAKAHRLLESRQSVGKVVVRW